MGDILSTILYDKLWTVQMLEEVVVCCVNLQHTLLLNHLFEFKVSKALFLKSKVCLYSFMSLI